MLSARPLYVPAPYQDAAESGRLILRDGSTATIRLAGRDDREALRALFARLSPESRRRRFFSVSLPSDELLDSLCDHRAGLTLIVTRLVDGAPTVIATGSYMILPPPSKATITDKRTGSTAEAAFAVDDRFHGKGLGTLLLERLAVLAVRHGVNRFWAVTHTDNRAMLDVFRDSGYEIHEQLDGGYIDIDLSVVPSAGSVSRSETRDRVATAASLRPFFWPRSVAVVGASRDRSAIGFRILDAILQNHFQGAVYPVNPKANEIAGVAAYPSVRAIPEPVDLAIIAVPRDAVLTVIDDCAARGVRAVVVITANFAETGADGRELQKRLLERVRGYGMRMIGPNCMGLLNTDPRVQLNASFAPIFPPPGRVAMSSQSGALGLAILSAAKRFRLGLSTFVSVGNKADVSGNDLLQYWEEDEGTNVILLYLESFGNPRRFARIARRVGLRKPIVVVKAGKSQAGKRAAGSHTAALAASDVAVAALFRQTGVIRAETLEEMFDLAAGLGSQPLPPGRRVAVITNAGGPGILCADACESAGLAVPELSAELKQRLACFLPAAASCNNPVDMIASASAEQYGRAVECVLSAGEIDALIVIYIPVGLVENEAVSGAILRAVAAARQAGARDKPVLACIMAEEGTRTQLVGGNERIPAYVFPESAANVLGKAAAYAEWRKQPLGIIPEFEDMDLDLARRLCREAVQQRGAGWLTPRETLELLTAVRLPVGPGGVAASPEEAVALAQRVGFPVAVKLASHTLVHKTEIGGIFLNVADEGGVRAAFAAMRDKLQQTNQLAAMEGVLVQPMVAGGVEVMVGVSQDPLFGPLVAFGLGGIHVEILADVCFRVTPLTDRDAAEMVRSIRGHRLLEGYRGHPAADLDALQEVLLRISRLVDEVHEIGELDLNPIFAFAPGQGCRIVDARIRVQPVE